MPNTTTQKVKYATATALNVILKPMGLEAQTIGALVIDGAEPVVGDLILVKDQADPIQNGVYIVTNTGGIGIKFLLNRYILSLYYEMGFIIYVTHGDVNASLAWVTSTSDEVFTCNVSPLICCPLGQGIISDESLLGVGSSDEPLGVHISDKPNNQLMLDDGLCVAFTNDGFLLGDGTQDHPFKINVSNDSDNIITYGSDGGLLARVNVTDTTTVVNTTFDGFSASTIVSVKYNVRGQVVTMEIDEFNGNSDGMTTFRAAMAIPLKFRPRKYLKKPCYVLDNGLEKKGTIGIDNMGNLELFVDVDTSFSAAGIKGLKFFTCSYFLN